MSNVKHQSAGKRPRGRPKGSAPFEERDRAMLSRFAELRLDSPGAKLAPFLAAAHYRDKDIRRAQQRWRREKDEFLKEARRRQDLSPAETIGEVIIALLASIQTAVDLSIPGLQKLAASYERARRRALALTEAGQGQGLPFKLDDTSDVDAAIERYERTMLRPEDEKLSVFGQLTVTELSPAQKLYALAISLHEYSLKAAEPPVDEATEDEDSASAVNGQSQ